MSAGQRRASGTTLVADTLVVLDQHGAPLACYGCVNALVDFLYPGVASGARPCHVCIRNPKQAEMQAKSNVREWEDNRPIPEPLDLYTTAERRTFERVPGPTRRHRGDTLMED